MKTGGYWHRGHWYDETPLLSDEQRGPVPETVPDEEVAGHPILCPCAPCARYPVDVRRRLKRRRVRS